MGVPLHEIVNTKEYGKGYDALLDLPSCPGKPDLDEIYRFHADGSIVFHYAVITVKS
jgi:hypothetical protein